MKDFQNINHSIIKKIEATNNLEILKSYRTFIKYDLERSQISEVKEFWEKALNAVNEKIKGLEI